MEEWGRQERLNVCKFEEISKETSQHNSTVWPQRKTLFSLQHYYYTVIYVGLKASKSRNEISRLRGMISSMK